MWALLSKDRVQAMLSNDELRAKVQEALAPLGTVRRVLLVHPDYSRNDFSDRVVPLVRDQLVSQGLHTLDTLNAGGTHRPMTPEELRHKLGLTDFNHIGNMYNHEYDDTSKLSEVGMIAADFVAKQTQGQVCEPMRVTANRLLFAEYDAIVCLSGTVPHEALGFSGGTKLLFPGISGPEVIGLLHWAAVLIGIPRLIGELDNPAREVVDAGAALIVERLGSRPIVSLNMVYTEDQAHRAVPRGLFSGLGLAGFRTALEQAAALSAQLHVIYRDRPARIAIQCLPTMYDEVWTAGKGSYKLQRPGVLEPGGEIILYAPHIHVFHSKPDLDAAIRAIGYHGRDYVRAYCAAHPDFNKNVAAHVINVRGLGRQVGGREEFDFTVTLATALSEADCHAVGLGYRDPTSIRREHFDSDDVLWIPDGGQWLYARR
ncbi:MAG: lactate racemase domain-containing protein [Gemmataceae bacterium]